MKNNKLQHTVFALLYCSLWSVILSSCTDQPATLFAKTKPSATGIHFVNTINYRDSFNILDYIYFYNGGGVAIGDINNDGWQDIYFTSNQGSNALYLNNGNFTFRDITATAGVKGSGNWKTGVTMADVNGDGLLDIYVCEVGKYKSLQGRNELFINNGNLTFTECAAACGLDVEGFNTQSVFFDYDRDGDLDMFLVNHSVHSTESYGDAAVRMQHNAVSGDKLFRNDSRGGSIYFTEVTETAGIYNSVLGYGLNVVAGDFNNDNWDDIYVSNDFHENDYYYINNRDGTFSEINRQAFGHESRFSMGSDAADLNNDGWLDLITLDMLPEDEKVLKSSAGEDPLDIYEFKMSRGYHHQYSKNCLQLNTGAGKKFSDIGLYAGVAATDWSWSALAADYNNDGIKDLFITNGIVKRPNDLDYLKFISNAGIRRTLQEGKKADRLAIDQMPEGKISNYIFQGTASLKFIDQREAWGFEEPTFSTGAAYADLDNDGDLDLVVNNINEPAGIYRNETSQQSGHHYLDIQLQGRGANTFGYGAKARLVTGSNTQWQYVTATRGFQSASTPYMHFGTGSHAVIDTLQITWPNGEEQLFTNLQANQLLVISQDNARVPVYTAGQVTATLFKDITAAAVSGWRHRENSYVDFNEQQLIPHEVSTQGPKIAAGDINGDGLDDFFVCGAAGQPGALFQQTAAGTFVSSNATVFAADSLCEDVNAVFFDADGDHDADLYVVSGGNQLTSDPVALSDRLYLNDGKGNFTRSAQPLPVAGNKSAVAVADFDADGDLDVFVGGRVVAGNYGAIPESFLLVNNGHAVFTLADDAVAPGLRQAGMVTDAVWTDIDKDNWPDLVIAGNWMPLTIYKNNNGRLQNSTELYQLQNTTGWWTTITAADLDGDGYPELLAGNWGENSKLHASEKYPLLLYTGDIDNNGASDQVLAIEKNKQYYPFLGKEELEKQLPSVIRKKYAGYSGMAGQTVQEIFGDRLNTLQQLSAQTLSSVLVKNNKGRLRITALPEPVQWSPVFAFATGDFNEDGKTDILAGGNFYGVLPYEGRYDAGCGNVLLNTGSSFNVLFPVSSGLLPDGEIRDIKIIRTVANRKIIVISRNNNTLLIYTV